MAPADETRTQEKDSAQDKEAEVEIEQNQENEERHEERRLKELKEELINKNKQLEEARAKTREKSLKQKIEEAEAAVRRLNEEIENESEVIIQDPISASKSTQEKEVQHPIVVADGLLLPPIVGL